MPPKSRRGPVFHYWLKDDLLLYLRTFAPTSEQTRARENAFLRLRQIIRGLGERYDVVDISVDSVKGRQCAWNSPIECYISDGANPDGLPPAFGDEPIPIAYDATSLAQKLESESYKGVIVDCKPDLRGYKETKLPMVPPESPVWGTPIRPLNSLYPIMPPVLQIHPMEEYEPYILLHPAHPSHAFRWALLRDRSEKYADFGILTAFLWQWTQSWNLPHFSQTTCAFLVLNFLQRKFGALFSEGTQPSNGFWLRLESNGKHEYSRVEVRDIIVNPGQVEKRLGFLVCQLLEFYAIRNHIVDVQSKDVVTRQFKDSLPSKDLDARVINTAITDYVNKVGKDGSVFALGIKQQPLFWKHQPLIIVDPVLPCHNVSHIVTRQAFQYFAQLCRTSFKSLQRGLPLVSILNHLPQQKSAVQLPEDKFSGYSNSSHSFDELFRRSSIPPSIHEARSSTISRIQSVIQEQYGKNFTVECFGSTQYGADSPTSDLDLVVVDHSRMNGFPPDVDLKTLPAIYNINNLGNTLRKEFKIMCLVSKATVPIVKFRDQKSRINCDINVNDQLGIYNTLLIARYCKLSPLLGPLILAIKKWAKSFGLNNPSGERGPMTFSSYALTLMTIGFLQAKGLLPNLQDDLPPLAERAGFWLRSKTGDRVRCDPRFNTSLGWRSPVNQSEILLLDILVAWFTFWGREHKYAQDLMSIRDGGLLPRSQAQPTEKKRHVKGKRHTGKKGEQTQDVQIAKADYTIAQSADGNRAPGSSINNEDNIDIFDEDSDKEMNGASEQMQLLALEDIAELGDDYDADKVAQANASTQEDVEEAALEESEEVNLRKGLEPKSWLRKALIVADPFILAKNCTGAIEHSLIDRFKAECQRAAWLLTQGCSFDRVMGNGKLYEKIPVTKPDANKAAPKTQDTAKNLPQKKAAASSDKKGKGKQTLLSNQQAVRVVATDKRNGEPSTSYSQLPREQASGQPSGILNPTILLTRPSKGGTRPESSTNPKRRKDRGQLNGARDVETTEGPQKRENGGRKAKHTHRQEEGEGK